MTVGGLDFTSALYLGLSHPSHALPAWSSLTTGAPAVIREPHVGLSVAAGVAALVGAEAGVVGTSTLHLSLDLFQLLAARGGRVYADACLYDVAAWGLEHAALRGARVRRFAAHSPDALRRQLERDAPFVRPPIVVTDGLCPACERVAPLAEYLKHTRAVGGMLVVDDTQGLGILGARSDRRHPYGVGGGGTMRQSGIAGVDVVIMASLAKGFGAPVAVLAGSANLIRRFRRDAATRVHCSPPSIPTLLAAQRALNINARYGDTIRQRLATNVSRFLARTEPDDFVDGRWHFPVQSISIPAHLDARLVHRQLAAQGVQTVLTRRRGDSAALTFLVTAAHRADGVGRAASLALRLLATDAVAVSEPGFASAV
ncbi:MAG: aminotransferase class [Gemmatimonadetes bacterium]|nr:aminotransferase class [Gemmatimonadota bacterium]